MVFRLVRLGLEQSVNHLDEAYYSGTHLGNIQIVVNGFRVI